MSAFLDHAAGTAVLPQVARRAAELLAQPVANPASLHAAGRAARRLLEDARDQLRDALVAPGYDVVFTSGGTEADNLAIVGPARARRTVDPRRTLVVISAVEHHAVLEPARRLVQDEGFELLELPVDRAGQVRTAALEQLLARDGDRVALVSVMWANNEVGALQPLSAVLAACAPHGIPVHSDAVQAVGQVPVDLSAVGPDLVSLSGHKVGGLPGTGALLLRRGTALTPLLRGGTQEGGRRAGSVNVVGAVTLALAVQLAVAARAQQSRRLAGLRERLVAGILQAVPDAVLHGPADAAQRLPGLAQLTFPGCEGDSLLYLLDSHAVACSTGSACQAGVARVSHVLAAMGVSPQQARGALRFSLGHTSQESDVAAVLAVIATVVHQARAALRADGADVGMPDEQFAALRQVAS